jgi:hypothetical protein
MLHHGMEARLCITGSFGTTPICVPWFHTRKSISAPSDGRLMALRIRQDEAPADRLASRDEVDSVQPGAVAAWLIAHR